MRDPHRQVVPAGALALVARTRLTPTQAAAVLAPAVLARPAAIRRSPVQGLGLLREVDREVAVQGREVVTRTRSDRMMDAEIERLGGPGGRDAGMRSGEQ